MARFELAIPVILEHEGGFVDDPVDPGGATNFGVSLRFLRTLGDSDADGWQDGDLDHDGDVDADDVRRMSRDQAIEIYREQWWKRYRYSRLISQPVATKVFDLAVNMGPGRAHRLLQQALRAAGEEVDIDGQVGPKTLAAVRAAELGNTSWPPPLIAALRSEAAGFYRQLVATKPECERFIRGWLRRAYF